VPRVLRSVTLFIALTLTTGVPAYADWYATPAIGWTFGTSAVVPAFPVDIQEGVDRKKLTLGGTGTLLGRGMFGIEGDFSLIFAPFQPNPEDLVKNGRVTTAAGNFVIATPLRFSGVGLRPYASAGPGLLRIAARDDSDTFSFARNMFALNVGGGVIGPLSEKRAVRFDLRYFRSLNGSDHTKTPPVEWSYSFWRASIGVMLKF
jgi:hypothetical protein